MGSCCGSPDSVLAAATPRCPRSGTKDLAVDLVTVNALLRESARTAVREGPYRFCTDPACAVVYFDIEGTFSPRLTSVCPSGRRSPLALA